MKNQDLFSMKNKKNRMSAQILLGALIHEVNTDFIV